ncbi:MAG: hypothetical protein RJA87_1435 [Pseudomonadota bacterium]|jgi:two-component system response regulator FixJ
MPGRVKTSSELAPCVHLIDSRKSESLAISALMEAFGYQVKTYPDVSALLSDISTPVKGCALLDGNGEQSDAMEAFQAIASQRPDLPIIMMSADGNIDKAVRFLKAGAYDFIEKPFDPDHLLTSMSNAFQSQQKNQTEADYQIHALSLLKRLTPREGEILRFLMLGESTKSIARHLEISPRTIDVHRGHIMEKLEARSVTDAIRTAMVGRFQ